MQIVSRREIVHAEQFSRSYEYRDMAGAGFSFASDKNGNVNEAVLQPESLENLRKCRSGDHDVVDMGVVDFSYDYWNPAVGLCVCGGEVYLEGFTNTCDECGRDYDSAGSLLAPRSQWCDHGEGYNEDGTPETVADVLRIR